MEPFFLYLLIALVWKLLKIIIIENNIIGSTKRAYVANNRNIGGDFLDVMKVNIELDREARKESIERDREERKESIKRDREERKESIEREREERKECRKMMMESLSVIAQTIALAFGGKKKKKRKRSNDLEVDDESDTESE